MNNSYFSITQKMKDEIKNFSFKSNVQNAGRVVACNDGVLIIEGLKDASNGELLYLSNGSYALALNLETNSVGAILLSSNNDISTGDIAYTTNRIVDIGVSEALLGRVINPLGEALDGKAMPSFTHFRSIESNAPAILDRAKVESPLYTGIKAIDAMIPIGKGQRELIIGDRQTGKTAIALDTIINQKGKNVICIYVAIGQKSSSVAKIIQDLRANNALSYTIIVSASAGQSAPLQYLAPYTGTAIAEEFMYSGRDVLIIYDDLSKHAVAYRTISLLLKRPSGREAYPGDIFYIHSRLLERSAQLNKTLGAGSLTSLPIIETLGGDISAYIPTNVISITDGQIYLENELFNSGVRPAINVGLSVSRVGGNAQCKAIRQVASKVRLELAHYRDMLLFARFGADLDNATKEILEKGKKLTEILIQAQYSPISMSDLVVTLYIMMKDLFNKVSADKISAEMQDFLQYFHKNYQNCLDTIAINQVLSPLEEEIITKASLSYLESKKL